MIINLSKPMSGAYEGRGFGRKFIWRYRCGNGHTVRVKAGSFRGKIPVPGIGAIYCPQCNIRKEIP